jgi:hypothetical protein
MGYGMSILWVLVFIVGNLAVVGVCLYAFGRRETQSANHPLSQDVRQAIHSLQDLTGEVTRRVEDNAEQLDGVVRELAALTGIPGDESTESLKSLQGSVKQQEAFAAYLRQSGEKFQTHGSRLGVASPDVKGNTTADPVGRRGQDADRKTESVHEAVGAVLAATHPGKVDERRLDDRETMSFTMCVLPLDSDFQPDGTPFVAVARDISTGGMSFSHTGPLSSPYLAVRMTLVGVQHICLVVDRRHTSRVGPMFITGGAFVCRLEEGDVWQMLLEFATSSDIAPVEGAAGRTAELAASQMTAQKSATS